MEFLDRWLENSPKIILDIFDIFRWLVSGYLLISQKNTPEIVLCVKKQVAQQPDMNPDLFQNIHVIFQHKKKHQVFFSLFQPLDHRTVSTRFQSGRLLACIASRPGQCGRADGYVLEGEEKRPGWRFGGSSPVFVDIFMKKS